MQIVVKQTSGLGNQLFQYAVGRCLAKRYGASLQMAHEFPPTLDAGGHALPAPLQQFAIPVTVRQWNLFDRVVASARPQWRGIRRLLRTACKIQIVTQSPERSLLQQQIRIAPQARMVYLRGLWQDYSMVREVEAELRRELCQIEPPRGRDQELAKRITGARNPVSLHLRCGDYGTSFGVPMALPVAYYQHAISHVLERERQSTFFVFSDDVAFAKDWLRGDPRFIVVDHNDEDRAHEDLRLMSLCRHHIIANTSFSWWGAWLDPRRDKQVIAPARWLGFDTSKIALACPEWTLLDAELPRRMQPVAARA